MRHHRRCNASTVNATAKPAYDATASMSGLLGAAGALASKLQAEALVTCGTLH
jgi:hypothetical protein